MLNSTSDKISIINKLHKSRGLGSLIHTLEYLVQRELRDCESVLDLGCGPKSPLRHCNGVKFSVGVESFEPYLNKSKSQKIHSSYIRSRIEEISIPEKSFDAVLMLDVIEHLDKKTGIQILRKAERWAKKKIVISTPNGFVKQAAFDGNPYQKHLSAWSKKELSNLGFACHGLAGIRWIREAKDESSHMNNNLLESIKFRPKLLWFFFATASQVLTYYFPEYSFGLFAIKNLDEK